MLSFRSPFDPSGCICKTSDYGYSYGWDSSARGQGTMILGCLTSRAVSPSRLPAASHQNSRNRAVSGFYLSISLSLCQYHSSNAPYPFIHLPPTLYNVSLPVLQFSPVSIIPPTLHFHSFTYYPHYIMFLSQYFSFPLSVPFHQYSIPIHSPTTHAI